MVNGVSRVVEILVWALAIVSLIIMILLVIGVSSTGKSTITNSYNTNTNIQRVPSYSSYSYPITRASYSPYSKPYLVDRYPYTARAYYVRDDLRYTKSYDRYLRYDDFGEYRRVKGILGNPINRYNVYVRNKDYIGGYFKVKFYFTDYYGRTSTESISRYIPARKQSTFVFKDIYGDRYKYYNWRYEVIPHTKAPTRVYYNTGTPVRRIPIY